MKCINCRYKSFEEYKDGLNRYFCNNPEAIKNTGSKLICKTERHSTELKIKTSPRWCPLKKEGA